ncbi:hypothetical protein ACTFIV_000757 [Dictyostelium citrinum]
MKLLNILIAIILTIFVSSSYAATSCPSGQELCATRCYNPTTQYCSYPENIVCQWGQQLCGLKCFTPGSGETCNQPGNLICPPSYNPCPSMTKCYASLTGNPNC